MKSTFLKYAVLAAAGLSSYGAHSQILPEPAVCCPGTNLITNGDFEGGNSGFTSAYTYQAGSAAGSVNSGEYGLLTSAEAQNVASIWSLNCPGWNKHLVVNATTETGGGNKLAWEQTIYFSRHNGGRFHFCGRFTAMRPCAFGPKSSVDITFGTTTSGGLLTFIPSTGGSVPVASGCNWTTFDQEFDLGSNVTSLTMRVFVDEGVGGDGNDIAMDNFSLVRLDSNTAASAIFNHSTSVPVNNTYNVTATAAGLPAQGCRRYWQVSEVLTTATPGVYTTVSGTTVTNPTAWQNLGTNTFVGYNGTGTLSGSAPGVFQVGKLYRVIYGPDCSCLIRRTSYQIVSVVQSMGRTMPVVVASGFVDDPAATTFGEARMNGLTGTDADVKVFPNPTDNDVTIQVPAREHETTLKVLNLTGQELQSIRVQPAQTLLNVSLKELPSGMYLLHMTDASGKQLVNHKVTKR